MVPGEGGWLEEVTVLRFTPAAPLAPGTEYAIHLGGDMRDADGMVFTLTTGGTDDDS